LFNLSLKLSLIFAIVNFKKINHKINNIKLIIDFNNEFYCHNYHIIVHNNYLVGYTNLLNNSIYNIKLCLRIKIYYKKSLNT